MPDPVSREPAGRSPLPEFMAHWRSLPCTHGVPPLSSYLDNVDPRFAPWTTIVDLGARDALPIRLLGTRMADTFGDHTGGDFLAVMPPDVRPVIIRAHRKMASLPCGWRTESRVVTTGGREVVIEMISLPLQNQGSTSCIVKLSHIVERLDYREALVKVLDLRTSQWIDLGAGTP